MAGFLDLLLGNVPFGSTELNPPSGNTLQFPTELPGGTGSGLYGTAVGGNTPQVPTSPGNGLFELNGPGTAPSAFQQMQQGVRGALSSLGDAVSSGLGGFQQWQQNQQAKAVQAPPVSGSASTATPSATPGGAGLTGFYQQHLPYAQQALQAAGWNPDLAPIMLGIAANEGAAAQGTLANAPYNNAFGVKATPDWTGGTVTMPTREFRNGQWVTEPATFRTYATPQESYADHIRFLQQNSRYAQAIQQQGSPTDFLQGLASAGYATDPQWADQVLSLARNASTVTAAPAAARGDLAQHILADAGQWVGVPYLWGGASREGADCSGFITSVFQEMGMPFPGGRLDAEGLRKATAPVAPDQAQPGDLIFFQGTDPTLPRGMASHVGIVTQTGIMLDTNTPGQTVNYTQFAQSPYWEQRVLGVGRPRQYGP